VDMNASNSRGCGRLPAQGRGGLSSALRSERALKVSSLRASIPDAKGRGREEKSNAR